MDKTEVKLDETSFAGTLFRPHGEYSSRIDGHFVLTQFRGPFNVEMLDAQRKLMVPLYAEAGRRGRFVVLVEILDSMLTSFEGVESIAKTMSLAATGTPQFAGVAHVAAPDVEGRDMMGTIMLQKVFRPAGIPYKIFDAHEPARTWLTSLLAETSESVDTMPR